MKKLAIVAALLLVAFSGCKKEDEDKLTADFSVKVGYWGSVPENTLIETADNLSVIVYDESNKAESYLWEWGDGESKYGVEPYYDSRSDYNRHYCNTHRYSESGTYTITLTVSNGDGETDCKSKTVTIL